MQHRIDVTKRWLSRLAPRQPPASRRRRLLLYAFAVVMSTVTVFAVADILFGVRERASRLAAYTPTPIDAPAAESGRARSAIRHRIGLLLQPREGKAGIGGDPSARLIEAGLLYGRLAVMEEQRGNTVAARSYMAQGVDLLRSAHHPTPTEDHIRDVISKQDARQRER